MGKRASERARARESERESALLVGVAAEAYWRRLIMRFLGCWLRWVRSQVRGRRMGGCGRFNEVSYTVDWCHAVVFWGGVM